MKKVLKIVTLFALMLLCVNAYAQNFVTTKTEQRAVSGHDDLIDLVFSFTMQPGWHVYGPDNTGGPTPMTLTFEDLKGAKAEGALSLSPTPQRIDDPVFGCEVTYFEKQGTATQRIRLTGGAWTANGYLKYGACNDQNCLPPTSVEFAYNGTYKTQSADAEAKQEAGAPADETAADTTAQAAGEPAQAVAPTTKSSLWTPVIDKLQSLDMEQSTQHRSLWSIFLLGILGGLIALVTPCVWPIIPMTVSFFLKRAKDDRKKGIKDAILYGLSIIVIYVGLGLLVTSIWGPSSLNALSTNAIFNLFLFALLVVF
ncbi:MAG: thiol:disulfide interchange protein, partial [Bacteroidales bacterium]|nr:thiol:disulfide interchange protein [Bacteroidales bacterium]